ncbi:MAG: LUD domain-containing protein [Prolixibacteraceae bacterium]|nr:LUD domain-containing protein [Prolixibacteraceae bacterium]
MSSSSREKILKRLQNDARDTAADAVPGISFFKPDDRPLLQIFQEQVLSVQGELIKCTSRDQLLQAFNIVLIEKKLERIYCAEPTIRALFNIDFTPTLNHTSDAAITGCELLVAHTGSVIVSTAQTKSRRTFAFPPVHIVVAYSNQLVGHLDEALKLLARKYDQHLPSQITVITGPSRTADIEKTLVLGAHGPKELIIFYLDVDFV